MTSRPIFALRKQNLVYFRNLKCASTFFSKNLQREGWKTINVQQITNNDMIFTHVMDPIKRRHKGIAEYIQMCGLTESFLKDPKLHDLLRCAPILDLHSLPYYFYFRSYLDQMTWIPIYGSYNDTIRRTEKWLTDQNISVDLYQYHDDHVHKSDKDKKKVAEILERYWNAASDLDDEWVWQYKSIQEPTWPDPPSARKDFHLLPEWIRKKIAKNFPSPILKVSEDLMSLDLHPHACAASMPTSAITDIELRLFEHDIKIWKDALEKFGISCGSLNYDPAR